MSFSFHHVRFARIHCNSLVYVLLRFTTIFFEFVEVIDSVAWVILIKMIAVRTFESCLFCRGGRGGCMAAMEILAVVFSALWTGHDYANLQIGMSTNPLACVRCGGWITPPSTSASTMPSFSL
jgi:hypothetical protein